MVGKFFQEEIRLKRNERSDKKWSWEQKVKRKIKQKKSKEENREKEEERPRVVNTEQLYKHL